MMNTFVGHIENLLLSNDCVIIPDFGGFVAHHIDACYDENEHVFIPPKRTLGFNSKLTMNDSLLAQSYVESEDISYPEACTRIEHTVERLNLLLENEGYVDFYGIGRIELNEDGKKTFSPFESGVLTPGLYGLGVVDIQPFKTDDNSLKDLMPAKVVSLTNDKSGDTISIKKSTLRALAAACIAFILFFSLPSTVNNSNTTAANFDVAHTALRLLPKSVSTNILPEQNLLITQQQAPMLVNATTTMGHEAHAEGRTYFTIVLASRISKKNATQFAQEMIVKGYTGTKVLTKKNTKVIYGVFSSENDAYLKLQQLRDNAGFKDAWVLKVKE